MPLKQLIVHYRFRPKFNQIDASGDIEVINRAMAAIEPSSIQAIVSDRLAGGAGFTVFKNAVSYGVIGRHGREKSGQPLKVLRVCMYVYNQKENVITADVIYVRADGKNFEVDEDSLRESLKWSYGEGGPDGYMSGNIVLYKPSKTHKGYELVLKLKSVTFTQVIEKQSKLTKSSKSPAKARQTIKTASKKIKD